MTIERLCVRHAPLLLDAPGQAAYNMFAKDESCLAIGVVDEENRPVGLISRHEFFLRFGDTFGRALWERRPVSLLMEKDPLVVDVNSKHETVAPLVANGDQRLYSGGFIVSNHGEYFGICDGLMLLKASIEDQKIRAKTLENHSEALEYLLQLQLAQTEDTKSFAQKICEVASDGLPTARASLWLMNSHSNAFECVAMSTRTGLQSTIGSTLNEADFGSYFAAIRANRVLAISDVQNDKSCHELLEGYCKPQGITAMLDAQILVGKDLLGILCCEDNAGFRDWGSEASAFTISLAERFSFFIQQSEIADLARQAEESNRSKSAFLANMSHEIRTPLNGVLGIIGALANTRLDPSQQEMVEMVRASGEVLERLLGDILDLSKIEAGKLQIEDASFDLQGIVGGAIQIHRLAADDKGLQIKVDFSDYARGLFLGDGVRIQQIISNLVSNAVKFTPRGEVSVRVVLHESELDVSKADLQIDVTDTGIGFDENTGRRLFGRFEQADTSTTRSFGGTGLGLSICQSLAHLMGGEICARSVLGQGSIFSLRIPTERYMPLVDFDRRTLSANDPKDSSEIEQCEGGLKILLVEDHPINQKVVSMILEPYGVDVVIANNGVEGVELYQTRPFDLILMDMQMPEMDGLAATRTIRSLEAAKSCARLPIVMLSANAMAEHVDQALAAGCDLHIGKPVTPKSLLEGIEQGLALAQATQSASANWPVPQRVAGIR